MKRIILLSIATMTIQCANAQGYIHHLIPQLREALGEQMEETYDAMVCADKHPTTYIMCENIAKSQLPGGLGDSLSAAFERELPLAQESDRYQVTKDGHKTLSYSLAIKGKLAPEKGNSIQFKNHFFDTNVETAAMLDVKDDSLLNFNYLQQTNQSIRKDYDTQPFDMLLDSIARAKDVKTESVEYILTDKKKRPHLCIYNNDGGIGRRTGTRYEVAKQQARQMMEAFKQIARSYFDSGQPVSITIEKSTCLAGFDWKEVRIAEMTDDGRLFLLTAKVVEGNMQIPGQWTKITYYKDGIER